MTGDIKLPNAIHRIGVEYGPWAMDTTSMDDLLARGQGAFDKMSAALAKDDQPTLVDAYRALRAETRATLAKKGSVGILTIEGALVKYVSWVTDVLGLSTYEALQDDLVRLIEDASIDAIILKIDTPGGEINGCSAFAYAVHEACKTKPVHAYINGQASAAGYWIASAAARIIVSPSATIGPISVATVGPAKRGREDSPGREFFTAKASCLDDQPKPAVWGSIDCQKLVNDLAEVIIGSAAEYRGTDASTIADAIGYDRRLSGPEAVSAGLADEVGTFEEALARLR